MIGGSRWALGGVSQVGVMSVRSLGPQTLVARFSMGGSFGADLPGGELEGGASVPSRK